MGKLLIISACALTLACLSACGGSGDSGAAANTPPAANVSPAATSSPPPAVANPPAQPTTAPNAVPHIAGTPGTEAVVARPYSFTPNATDADGDSLAFSIASKPGWASFDAANGRLSGTPAAGDVGSHEEITISVTDGKDAQSLPQFTINVVPQSSDNISLAWQAPTQNTDGSVLTNLSGYKIHYGSQSGHYTSTVTLNNAGLTRYVVANLAHGAYFFAITALATDGAESELSGEVNKTI